MKVSLNIQTILTVLVVFLFALPLSVSAQVPARFYWKSLDGGSAVPVIYMDMSGNSNPLDPSHFVVPESSFEASVALGGYAKAFSLFDRSALVAALLPVGRISGGGSLFGRDFNQNTNGFGDPTLEFVINVLGPPSIKNIPEAMRYEPGFSVDLLVDLIVPIGEYDNEEVLNMGQNRWYGRIGAPVVWQIGSWVPGRRTTLELLPSAWVFGDNDDFVGHTLSTDPKFQLEAHLTRDFHKDLWGSIDINWMRGGKSSLDGLEGDDLDMVGLGFTLGYQFSDNVQLTAGYLASVNDDGPTDLQMDVFKVSLVFGWHPLVEGMKRLGGE
ncbi:MAG: transporter [Halioglobus sp.]